MNEYLGNYKKWEKKVKAFLAFDENAKGGEGEVKDWPIAIKDVLLTKDFITTAGSKMLSNYQPLEDATAVKKLRDSGAAIIGKTNCDEFAMGGSTEFSAYGATKNPWDLLRVPGGSSGGSAAAVATGMARVALGTDTGGSVRQPASFCGVLGLKPTYGRISRYGLIAMASSLDTVGIFSRNASDAKKVLEIISGPDPLDSTSLSPNLKPITYNLKPRFSLGVIKEIDMAPEVKNIFERTKKIFEKIGAEFVEMSIPLLPLSLPIYYIIMPAEVSSNLARYDGLRFGAKAEAKNLDDYYKKTRGQFFGPEVKRRILLGAFVLSHGYHEAYYDKARALRTALRRQVDLALSKCDALFLPTSPTPAFLLGEKLDDPVAMYLSDLYTVFANLTGHPAVSFPAGFVGDLPFGMQFCGANFAEEKLLDIISEFEKVTNFHKKEPSI